MANLSAGEGLRFCAQKRIDPQAENWLCAGKRRKGLCSHQLSKAREVPYFRKCMRKYFRDLESGIPMPRRAIYPSAKIREAGAGGSVKIKQSLLVSAVRLRTVNIGFGISQKDPCAACSCLVPGVLGSIHTACPSPGTFPFRCMAGGKKAHFRATSAEKLSHYPIRRGVHMIWPWPADVRVLHPKPEERHKG